MRPSLRLPVPVRWVVGNPEGWSSARRCWPIHATRTCGATIGPSEAHALSTFGAAVTQPWPPSEGKTGSQGCVGRPNTAPVILWRSTKLWFAGCSRARPRPKPRDASSRAESTTLA